MSVFERMEGCSTVKSIAILPDELSNTGTRK